VQNCLPVREVHPDHIRTLTDVDSTGADALKLRSLGSNAGPVSAQGKMQRVDTYERWMNRAQSEHLRPPFSVPSRLLSAQKLRF
jgi:hypothetical protein